MYKKNNIVVNNHLKTIKKYLSIFPTNFSTVVK